MNVDVEANLHGEFANLRYTVQGHGRELVCRLDGNPAEFVGAAARLSPAMPALRTVAAMLDRIGLHLVVQAGNVRIAEIGAGVEQNTVTRALNVPHARFGV